MLNDRLSSKKALEILEFLCKKTKKKKLGAARCNCGISQDCIWKGQDFAAIPNGSLLEVVVNVEFDNGKGYRIVIQAQHPSGFWSNIHFKKTTRLSWASILKKLMHYANKYGYMIVVGSACIIRPGDMLEQILVEMDLEGCIE